MLRQAVLFGCFVVGVSGFGCADTDSEVDLDGSEVAPSVPGQSPQSPADVDSETDLIVAEELGAAEIPDDLLALFGRIDELGREAVGDAEFVEVTMRRPESREDLGTETAWRLREDDATVTLLRDDLAPWVFNKRSATTLPSSWSPVDVILGSVEPADFASHCEELIRESQEQEDDPEQEFGGAANLYAPGPSHNLLIAHAAWKRGLTELCEQIVALNPQYESDFEQYESAVWEDLAWLHYLRGVNLLMFADRADVVPHLRLVSEISPAGEFAAPAEDLSLHIEQLIADETEETPDPDVADLDEVARAQLYVSQIKDLRCQQMSQPGAIHPYFSIVDGVPDQNPSTMRLREMGMPAIPALIDALHDDTPTRTVYHWRDFHRSREVWRVSDFAWHILRDITGRDFGDRRVVGFTFSRMSPDQKVATIRQITDWYEENRDRSPDDRMLSFFSSESPDDWITAGRYFLDKDDDRAVLPLLEKIAVARQFTRGDLCELVARFGDQSAIPVIQEVLQSAREESDRVSAAIALWQLGDESGVPVVIQYVLAEDQPYGSWDTPVWFLVWSHTSDGMEALTTVVSEAPPRRAADVLRFILASISGDLWGDRRPPAGCVEICPVLIAGMERSEESGGSVNGVASRLKDIAAKTLALLREGTDDEFGGRFANVDPDVFNEVEPDASRRDAQIEVLQGWYETHKDALVWNEEEQRLAVGQPE